MKKVAIGLALLFALCLSPAAQACGYLCTEIWENCWGCVYTGDDSSGCRPVGGCGCRDEICWYQGSAAADAAVTPEAFGIFAPKPNSTMSAAPMSVAIK